MRDWLQTRGKAFLSLLSDLGGALGFVVFAVALIAAAVSGTVLLALEVFPQPFLGLLVLGVGLLAAGLALHFLQDLLAPPARATTSVSLQQPDEAHAGGGIAKGSPYSQAAALQRQHEGAKARKAIRRIREELLDNRRHVQRASEGDMSQIQQISSRAWHKEEETLLELPDPQPHSSARQAYRELEGIREVLYIRKSLTTLRLRSKPRELLETDVHTTFEAIDEAVEKLNEAEGG